MVTDNGIAVFHILDKSASTYDNFNNIKNNIKRLLLGEKKKEYAIKILNQQDWANGNIDTSIVNILQNKEGIIRGRFDEIGTSNELVGTLLGLESGKTSNARSTYNTVCRVKMNSKDSFIKDHQDLH